MPAETAAPAVNPWIISVSVMFATFMEVLDTTVVNVSLPHIAGSLSASVEEATWTLTSYLVANAIVLPITGWLASFFGRKRVLMAAVMGFTGASVCCGFAPNLATLIMFRLIQGATGGALQPLSQAVMLEAFPPHDRGKAMGFWGLGIVVAPMLGPVLGGWLTENYSWRWVFYINLPVGLIAILMIQFFIFDPTYIRRGEGRVDYWGIGLLALAMACLQIALDKGQQEDWFDSRFITGLMLTFAAATLMFLVREVLTPHPVVNLRVFRNRTYATGVVMITVVGFVLYGSLVALPIFLQVLLGYPAIEAGLALLPRGLGSFVAMPLVGALLARFDPRKALMVGLVGGGFTLFAFGSFNLDIGYWNLAWPQFLQGASLALLFVPLTTTTMDPIAREAMGNATSIFNLMRNVGGSVGIAVATTFIARRQQLHINQLGEHINPYNPQAQRMLGALQQRFQAQGSDPVTAGNQAVAGAWGMVQQQAALLSYLDTFILFGYIFFLAIPLVLLMRRPRHKGGPVAAH